jgi:2-polyprenyl-6-methoxyphenol hydroxylase-like FAD-dependent oxidoreductase
METLQSSSTSTHVTKHPNPKIAIIGASYAGLALANILHMNEIPYTIFESKYPPFTYITGGSEFNVPSMNFVLATLDLQLQLLKKGQTIEDASQHTYTREDIIGLMWERVKDHVVCGTKVTNIKQQDEDAGTFYMHYSKITNEYSKGADGIRTHVSGPYDCIIGADGVLSICRTLALPRNYLVGDARWVNDRWYDLGFMRINQGADLAMLDGIEFGMEIVNSLKSQDCQLLLLEGQVRKKFGANEIWAEKRKRKLASLAIFSAFVERLLFL